MECCRFQFVILRSANQASEIAMTVPDPLDRVFGD